MENQADQLPVIIIGAGIVGLTFAQALKKEGIPFEIHERDESPDHRAAGWGITIHWALEALQSCLPKELFAKIDGVQVDPEQGRQDTGRFLFLDLETLEPKYVIPPSPRKRVIRSKLRGLLTEGLEDHIHWGKSHSSFSFSSASNATPNSSRDGDRDRDSAADKGGITATFSDGTFVHGSMLIGADGSSSKTRALLLGEDGALQPLPVRFMGVTPKLSDEQMRPLRRVDPLLFQGAHPRTGCFMWFSVLSTPGVNGSATAEPYYEAQINLSWIASGPEDEVPPTDAERLEKMKEMVRRGTGFHGVLRGVVEGLPEGIPVREIKIADWVPTKWDGKRAVTLLGDAAHPMTMYRGEAANHGFLDASKLVDQLKLWHGGLKTKSRALGDFETEMRLRTYEAVLLSRRACLDAHDIENLGPNSPLVSRRARVLEPGVKV